MVFETDRENRRESTEEKVGEGVGGVGGALGGAALGSALGPVGTVLGAIAGGGAGWWAGEKAGRAAEGEYTEDVDRRYRTHWESDQRPDRVGDYDRARVGYGVGHYAAGNPDWSGKSFDEVEPEIRRNWQYQDADYDTLRPYVREGYMGGSKSVTYTTK